MGLCVVPPVEMRGKREGATRSRAQSGLDHLRTGAREPLAGDVDVQKTVQRLDEKGVRLLILTLGIDAQTPAGRLIFGIMSQLGQFER
jgi:DNA invertase Pin-like site-specific DNA recombinase